MENGFTRITTVRKLPHSLKIEQNNRVHRIVPRTLAMEFRLAKLFHPLGFHRCGHRLQHMISGITQLIDRRGRNRKRNPFTAFDRPFGTAIMLLDDLKIQFHRLYLAMKSNPMIILLQQGNIREEFAPSMQNNITLGENGTRLRQGHRTWLIIPAQTVIVGIGEETRHRNRRQDSH